LSGIPIPFNSSRVTGRLSVRWRCRLAHGRPSLLKQKMQPQPLSAFIIPPHPRASHVKNPPIRPPLRFLIGAVSFGEDGTDLVFVAVHVGKPRLGGLLIMHAADT